MADLVLRLGGSEVEGWTQIQVTRSIDQLADTFDLAIASSKLPDVEIGVGAACEVRYGDETVLSGYIDDFDGDENATSMTIAVSGRSRAGDLCDCSAVHVPWRDTPGLQIAEDLCQRFGIRVTSDIGILPTEKYFKPTEGESVFDVLLRLARMNGARIVSHPDGSIRFTRTGVLRYPDVVIQRGLNVVAAHIRESWAERFSHYIFKAQLATSDEAFGEAATAKFEVVDAQVDRYRPLVVPTDHQPRDHRGRYTKTPEGERPISPLEELALWELHTRAGKSLQLQFDVANPDDPGRSWEHKYGLWEPNTIVSVQYPPWGIAGEFLVTSVTLSRDDSGTRTAVSLTHPDAYDIIAPPRKKQRGTVSW